MKVHTIADAIVTHFDRDDGWIGGKSVSDYLWPVILVAEQGVIIRVIRKADVDKLLREREDLSPLNSTLTHHMYPPTLLFFFFVPCKIKMLF